MTYYSAPIGKVNIGPSSYDVFPLQPFSNYSYSKTTVLNQFNENLRQSVGINISIPIFNSGVLRTNYEKSKLNIATVVLQKDQDNQKLKQDIYQVYLAALIAMEKWNASKKSVEAAQRSVDFSLKKFNTGMLTVFELSTNRNILFKARLEALLNQFDYIFKIKVLEFYKGDGLRL